jgi:hypothetical protein
MSGVYESLKLKVQDTFQRSKTPSVRAKSSSGFSLDLEIEELERMIATRLAKVREAVRDGQAEVVDEAKRANELVEKSKLRIAVLETKLKKAEETAGRKYSAREQIEGRLKWNDQAVQNYTMKKEQMIAAQRTEIFNLKLDIDGKVKRIEELESGIKKGKEETAHQAEGAAECAETPQAKLAALENDLKESQYVVHEKESTIEVLEQKLAAKTQEFEEILKDKARLLAWQEAEIADLNTKLLAVKQISEMSSFHQADASPGAKRQDVAVAFRGEPANGLQAKSVEVEPDATQVLSIMADAAVEIVAPELFKRIAGELVEVTGVMDPVAFAIVRQQVNALGESIERFPRSRLPELLESLAADITDEKQQIDFRSRSERSTHLTC